MRKNLRSVSTVAVSTLGSRFLGLFRDILLYATLGLSATTSAFLLAFTLPNLFRRLFGEGALTTALVPLLASEEEARPGRGAFALLNRILRRAVPLLALLGLAGLLVAGLPLLLDLWPAGRFREAAALSLVLFPYVLPICLAAVLAATLQVLGRFFLPALNPVLLNLAMIAVLLGPATWWTDTPRQQAFLLSGAVLAGGLLQLALPALQLRSLGWRPRLDPSPDPAVDEVRRLFLPALSGAAILQLNILVSRALAFGIGEDAVALLYLAARLVELPLGLFAIATATVLFPQLARHAGSGEETEFREAFRQGSALVAAVTVPAFLGLALLGDPVLRVLFAWGLFDAADAARAAPVLAFFAVGLPFFAQATLLSRALQARRDAHGPMRVAGWTLLVNLALSLALMIPFGATGLAAANSLAAVAQTLLLHGRLHRHRPGGGSWWPVDLWKVGAGSLAVGALLLLVPEPGATASRVDLLLHLSWVVPTGVVLGLGLPWLLRFRPFLHLPKPAPGSPPADSP